MTLSEMIAVALVWLGGLALYLFKRAGSAEARARKAEQELVQTLTVSKAKDKARTASDEQLNKEVEKWSRKP